MKIKKTIPEITNHKVSAGNDPLVMVTAYDAPTARILSEAEVDMILVGDTLAMVLLGHDNTLNISVGEMVHHIKAVANAKPNSLIVGDMPWLSYHLSTTNTIKNAAELIRSGAHCVKLEGGRSRVPMIEGLINAEIAVIGHLGLTPQSSHKLGGFKVQGKSPDQVTQLIEDAKILEATGCFALVLEAIPAELAQEVTSICSIPTIGIGAGPNTDGQVLVYQDLIGLENRFKPKFVRRYNKSYDVQLEAVKAFSLDVRNKTFPSADETY